MKDIQVQIKKYDQLTSDELVRQNLRDLSQLNHALDFEITDRKLLEDILRIIKTLEEDVKVLDTENKDLKKENKELRKYMTEYQARLERISASFPYKVYAFIKKIFKGNQ